MNKPLYFITHSGVISLAFDGRTVTVQTDFPNYAGIRQAIDTQDWDAVLDLVDVAKSVQKQSGGRILIVDDQTVNYDGAPLHNAMTERLLNLVKDGYQIGPFIKFMENVMENPSKTAVDELYLFLEKNDIPITDDGCFLAYKKVSGDFKSIHASPDGTHLDHSIGAVVTMPRNQVNENRHQTCSTGLHCCSRSYLRSYGGSCGNKVVVVKVHPKDVVTIPSDYGNAKMRACGYTVVKEHAPGQDVSAFNRPVYKADGVSPIETVADLADQAKTRVVEIIDSFFRDMGTLNYKESFAEHGITGAEVGDLMLEIEEELDLNIHDDEIDHISEHSPILVLSNFYELTYLKQSAKKKVS